MKDSIRGSRELRAANDHGKAFFRITVSRKVLTPAAEEFAEKLRLDTLWG
jgi:hypothetical protein